MNNDNTKKGLGIAIILLIIILLFTLPMLFLKSCSEEKNKNIDKYEESKRISEKEYEEYRKKAARDPGPKKEWYNGCD